MVTVNGRTAVVTGAASGLGRATALRLAAEGARVIAVDLDSANGHRLADEIGGVFVLGDVSSAPLWTSIAEQHEPVIAVLCAGISGPLQDITDVTDERYARLLAVNVDQIVYATRALVPVMRRRNEGSVVAVSSIAGLVPVGSGNSVYCLTKHAVVGFVRAVAADLAVDRIAINCVCPGVMDTPMAEFPVGILRGKGRGAEVVDPAVAASVIVELISGDRSGAVIALERGDRPPRDMPPPATEFRSALLPGEPKA